MPISFQLFHEKLKINLSSPRNLLNLSDKTFISKEIKIFGLNFLDLSSLDEKISMSDKSQNLYNAEREYITDSLS